MQGKTMKSVLHHYQLGLKGNNMNRYLIVVITLSILVLANCQVKGKSNRITYKYGVAIINGKAAFINVEKLREKMPGIMVASKNHIRKYKGRIVKNGKIIWNKEDSSLKVYDTEADDPYWRIIESEKKYFYKVNNNSMFISNNRKEWDKLEITIIDENPKQPNLGVYSVHIYMIIQLKCKWFEGEYEMIGSQG